MEGDETKAMGRDSLGANSDERRNVETAGTADGGTEAQTAAGTSMSVDAPEFAFGCEAGLIDLSVELDPSVILWDEYDRQICASEADISQPAILLPNMKHVN